MDANSRAHQLFRLILTEPEWTRESARAKLELSEAEFELAQRTLVRVGLLRPSADPPGYAPVSPEISVARLLALEEQDTLHRLCAVRELRSTMSVLASNLLPLQAGALSDSRIDLLRGEQQVSAALEGAAVRAQSEILSMHPGTPLPQATLEESMERNQSVLARGVTMRSIQLNAMAKVPYGRAHLQALQDAGCLVRLAAVLPFRLILVDEVLAYVSTSARDGALEIRGREVCWLLRQTFEYCWVHGTAPSDSAVATAPEIDVSEREIALIRMLAAGSTDDAIARALGISTRTLRRMMTGVMEKLGAVSRFQAGFRAAALGLLDDANAP